MAADESITKKQKIKEQRRLQLKQQAAMVTRKDRKVWVMPNAKNASELNSMMLHAGVNSVVVDGSREDRFYTPLAGPQNQDVVLLANACDVAVLKKVAAHREKHGFTFKLVGAWAGSNKDEVQALKMLDALLVSTEKAAEAFAKTKLKVYALDQTPLEVAIEQISDQDGPK